MTIVESILYGFVSGVTEFLPVSARAHQALLRYLFGVSTRVSLQDILVHIGVVLSIIIACRENLTRLFQEQRSSSRSRRGRPRSLDTRSYYDLRLLKTATLPLLAGMLLYAVGVKLEGSLIALMILMSVNGVVLLMAEHTRRGNRDSRTMNGLDGIVMGIAGATSVFPGISRTAMITSYATARGANGSSAANWAILLCIPATLFSVCYDVFLIIGGGIGAVSAIVFAGYMLSGVAAFCGGYIGISILRLMAAHTGVSNFAYYAFGCAMFTFLLYLLT